MNFPIFKTKREGVDKKFNLADPKERQEYFRAKIGDDIDKLKKHIENNTFIVYLMGKKNSGKGTYAKMFAEIMGSDKIEHFSVGDMIRGLDEELNDKEKREALVSFLKDNYRGWTSVDDILDILEGRSTQSLLPTDLILTLIKREVSKREKKVIFIDGFPRDMDQISYSIFFRDLIGYREDPDVFVLIDVPNNVIDERIKWRRICPLCKTSRNIRLLPTSKIRHKDGDFVLLCDNPECEEVEMIAKEGDEKGIEPIKERLETDEKLIKQALSLHGIPKILLRNTIPVELANEYADDYELTPGYSYKWDEEKNEVVIEETSWIVKDGDDVDSHSLMAPPVVISLISQMVDAFNL